MEPNDDYDYQITLLDILKDTNSWPMFFVGMFCVTVVFGSIMWICGMVYNSIVTLYLFFVILFIASSFFTRVTKGLSQKLFLDNKLSLFNARFLFFALHTSLLTLLMDVMDKFAAGMHTTFTSIFVIAIILSACGITGVKEAYQPPPKTTRKFSINSSVSLSKNTNQTTAYKRSSSDVINIEPSDKNADNTSTQYSDNTDKKPTPTGLNKDQSNDELTDNNEQNDT